MGPRHLSWRHERLALAGRHRGPGRHRLPHRLRHPQAPARPGLLRCQATGAAADGLSRLARGLLGRGTGWPRGHRGSRCRHGRRLRLPGLAPPARDPALPEAGMATPGCHGGRLPGALPRLGGFPRLRPPDQPHRAAHGLRPPQYRCQGVVVPARGLVAAWLCRQLLLLRLSMHGAADQAHRNIIGGNLQPLAGPGARHGWRRSPWSGRQPGLQGRGDPAHGLRPRPPGRGPPGPTGQRRGRSGARESPRIRVHGLLGGGGHQGIAGTGGGDLLVPPRDLVVVEGHQGHRHRG